jgi:hypothetical protein
MRGIHIEVEQQWELFEGGMRQQLGFVADENRVLLLGLVEAHDGFGDPRHLGAEIGFFNVLHTWNQKLLHHPHVHCVVPAGGLAPDHTRWIATRPGFFLPVRVLSRVFRGKFVAGLRQLHAAGELNFHGIMASWAAPAAAKGQVGFALAPPDFGDE